MGFSPHFRVQQAENPLLICTQYLVANFVKALTLPCYSVKICSIVFIRRIYLEVTMEKKDRSVKDKRYEQRHKEERKAKCMVWGTSVPREKAEHINEFLNRCGYTKVQLIEAGYRALLDDAAEHDTSLAKIIDGYDDFFEFEKRKP